MNTEIYRSTTRVCFATVLLGLVLERQASADFDYASYQPYSIRQAIVDHPHDPETDYLIEAGNFKYRVRVIYAGETRAIEPSVKDLIVKWGKSLQMAPSIVELFKHVILVREGRDEFWLPIQEPLLPSVAEELTSGSAVDLYIFRIGSTKTDWVFVVNEFQTISGSK